MMKTMLVCGIVVLMGGLWLARHAHQGRPRSR